MVAVLHHMAVPAERAVPAAAERAALVRQIMLEQAEPQTLVVAAAAETSTLLMPLAGRVALES